MSEVKSKPVNVIVVMTDDQGYGDLGCTGNPWLQTPYIDSFSAEAARCNNFHVSPLCTPSRGAIMTGRYPVRNGAWATAWGRSILRRDELTMANVFAHNGYNTGLFGKWHLGDAYPYRPQDRGFNTVVAHKGGGVGQTPDFWGNNYFNDTYFHNNAPYKHEGYCTDIWFDEAKAFIESCGSQPFFAFIATNAPHSPYFVDSKYADQYRDNPDILEPEFYGMISNIDENFGSLNQLLIDRGLHENTLLIFMTDNGSSGGAETDEDEFTVAGFNAGMRGMKMSYYEGGHRVPFFARCPVLGIGNRDVDALLSHIDLLPTFNELLDLDVPRPVNFDGINVSACLTAEAQQLNLRPVFMQYCQNFLPPEKWHCAVLKGQWRLIYGCELYDVNNDPEQRSNVASEYPDIVTDLRKAHSEFWHEVSPSLNLVCPHIVGNDAENPVRLDAMDVMGDIAWDQPHILEALKTTGLWTVQVEQAGIYRFRLCRWPDELDLPINAVPAAENRCINNRHGASGLHKCLDVRGAVLRIAGRETTKEIAKVDAEAVFELELSSFIGTLEALFEDENGEYQGVYYVYVERI